MSGGSRRRKAIIAGGVALGAAVLVGLAFLFGVFSSDSGGAKQSGGTTTLAATDPSALLQQGLTAQGAGRLDEARALYLKVIGQDPTNKFAYYNLGVIYQQLNAVNDARDSYRRALQIDAKYQPALFNLAVLETPLNPTEAISQYQKILAINPSDANVHLNLGLVFRQIGRTSEGEAELAKAVQLNPALASRIPPK